MQENKSGCFSVNTVYMAEYEQFYRFNTARVAVGNESHIGR